MLPRKGISLFKPDSYAKSNEHYNNIYKKIVSNYNTWITFTKIERVIKDGSNDKVAEEFKQVQMDVRDGKWKNHYQWLLKHCQTVKYPSYDHVKQLCRNNQIGETTVLVPTREMMYDINLAICYAANKYILSLQAIVKKGHSVTKVPEMI